MSKFTPGPWKIGGEDETYPGKISIESEKYFVALADFCQAQEANARLIAAAPDLLEALQAVQRMIKWAKENDDSPKSALSHFVNSEPVFAAAIAKATGE